MAKGVLLVLCPCWGVSNPPLGLAALSSFLRAKDLDARVLDLNIEMWRRASPEGKALWDGRRAPMWWFEQTFASEILPALRGELDRAAERIARDSAEVIGFSTFVSNRLFTRELIARLRALTQKTIILGGRGINDPIERRQFSAGLVDFFYVGEGEASMHLFLRGQEAAPGIIRDPDARSTPVVLPDLGELPLIDYRSFDMGAYAERTLCLQMTRGCSLRCAFCNDWRYIGQRRSRPGRAIFQEIEHHVFEYGITSYVFNDQAINVDLRELDTLCDAMLCAPFVVQWTALAIPSRSLDLALLRKMREAGCEALNYGIESGSQRVLGLMNKPLRIDEVERVLRDTRRAGIRSIINLIVGFPGETEDDFDQTLEFVSRNREHISGVSNANTCDVIIGSALHQERDRFGVTFPDIPEGKYREWTSREGGNDPDVRGQRLQRLLDRLGSHGLNVWTSNAR